MGSVSKGVQNEYAVPHQDKRIQMPYNGRKRDAPYRKKG